MFKLLQIVFFLSPLIGFTQDTVNVTGVPGNFWVDHHDSILKFVSKEYCWRREEFVNDTLFSIEYLALNKHHPVKNYTGYYPNGKIAFKRTYLFDGQFSEAHGVKQLYYANGNLKEEGSYHHGVKWGNWSYYNPDGTLKIWTQYDSPVADTLSSFSYLAAFKDKLMMDTLTTEADTSFYDLFPCASFGKNGVEVHYESKKPVEGRKYKSGKLVFATRKRGEIKRLIRKSALLFPDIKLCPHGH